MNYPNTEQSKAIPFFARFLSVDQDEAPTPDSPRAVSFKLSTADFESINLTEDSQVYLSLTKTVSHNK